MPYRLANPQYGVPTGIRTPDLRLRRPLLYPAELLAHKLVNVFLMKLCNVNTSYKTKNNWWAIRDLNPGPAGYEPDALTN